MKEHLKDAEWLREKYQSIGARKIAEMLGVSVRTVHNWMTRHEIPRSGNEKRLPKKFKNLLKNREKFEESYRSLGVSGICVDYSVSRTAVYNALNDLNIRLTKGVDPAVIQQLEDPSKLYSIYCDQGVTPFANKAGINKTTVYNYMYKHGIDRDENSSSLEKSFENFLIDNKIKYIRNSRDIIEGLELDFYIPESKVAIELNGLYWHSSKFIKNRYHLEKTEKSESAGIQLLHIFEDDWIGRRIQWESKVLSVLGMDPRNSIGARSTKLEVVHSSSLKSFFEENHIQGFSGGFYAVRLVDSNKKTVAAAIYKKDSSDKNSVILNRYATSNRVVGGLSKIMKHSCKYFRSMGLTKVVSFADRTMSDGSLYLASGWNLDDILPPDYRYHYNGRRVRKQNFRRKNLEKILGEKFNPNESELKNTLKNGIYRVYDCGLFKFSFSLVT